MNINKRYEEVERFNKIAGNLDNITVESVNAQMKVFIEEAKETEAAFANKDAVELLDGICDSFVTLGGLMQKAERAGFKVDEALKRVNDNNLTKFEKAEKVIVQEGMQYFYNKEFDVVVTKDKNGKIRKPVGFKSVEISDLAPKDFFGEKP